MGGNPDAGEREIALLWVLNIESSREGRGEK